MNAVAYFKRRFSTLPERSRAVGMFFATSLVGRGVGIGCQLLQVPIAIHALGAEAFGLWMTLTGLGAMILFADFGLGQGAQNRFAEAFARGRPDEARILWSSAFAFLSLVAITLWLGLATALRFIDVPSLFSLGNAAVRVEAGRTVLTAAALFCANFPLGLSQRLAYGRQRGWMHNIAQACGSLGGLIGIIVAAQRHWPLAGFIAAAQAPLVASNAGLLLVQLLQLGWLRLWRSRVEWGIVRELWRIGAFFGVQQIQLTLSLALPPLVISTTLGAAAVTPYNLSQRLFNLFAIVQNAFMLPLWPAYSDAGVRGEYEWIRRTLRRSLGATLLGTLAPMALGALCARPLLALWIGGTHELPSRTLVWLMFAWNALNFLQQPFGYMLAGLSVVRRQTLFALVSSAASLVLMEVLGAGFGAEGVVLGMILGFLPFLVFGNITEARRVLRGFPRAPGQSPWAKPELANAT